MTEFSAAHQSLIDSIPVRDGALIVEETIEYEHDGETFEGFLVYDASITGTKPGVVIVHDWSGLREYPKARAHMLARLGYAAFAIDVYGKGVRFDGSDPDGASAEAGKYYADLDLLRARVRAGFDAAVHEANVDADRVAVLGYCFGGSATLEFARTGAPARGFASFHGGLVAHEPADVDQIAAPLLVMTGGADPVVPDDAILTFENELRTRDDIDWQVITYSGAPHGFTLPETPNYRAAADARSWRELEGFLAEVLA
jgi:dienelactone hydrolase